MKIEKVVITCDGCGEVLYDSDRDFASNQGSPYLQININSPSGGCRGDYLTEPWSPGTYWFCGIACLGHYVVDKLTPARAGDIPIPPSAAM